MFCMVPSTFVRSVRPNPRGLITIRFIMVVAFSCIGWLTGQGLFSILNQKRKLLNVILAGSLLVMALVMLYPIRAAILTYSGAPHFQKWANLWDIRDANIRNANLNGVLDVEVMHLDKVIKRVGELSPDPDSWYNRCAAGYYGINSISATIPVWDK